MTRGRAPGLAPWAIATRVPAAVGSAVSRLDAAFVVVTTSMGPATSHERARSTASSRGRVTRTGSPGMVVVTPASAPSEPKGVSSRPDRSSNAQTRDLHPLGSRDEWKAAITTMRSSSAR